MYEILCFDDWCHSSKCCTTSKCTCIMFHYWHFRGKKEVIVTAVYHYVPCCTSYSLRRIDIRQTIFKLVITRKSLFKSHTINDEFKTKLFCKHEYGYWYLSSKLQLGMVQNFRVNLLCTIHTHVTVQYQVFYHGILAIQ
jgi:hypothetical protein